MEHAMEVLKMIMENAPMYIAAINALLVAIIAVAVLIPGEQPEKALQKVVDFLAKISRK